MSNGFTCSYDGCSFRCQSYELLTVHLNKEHMILRAAYSRYIRGVSLQSWYSRCHKYAGYWIVAGKGFSYDCITSRRDGDDLRGKLEVQEQMRLTALEQDRQDYLGHSANPKATKTTPWLQHTQWPQQFADRPLSIIAASACLPKQKKPSTTDYILRVWEGSYFFSPVEDEIRLHQLVRSIDLAFHR